MLIFIDISNELAKYVFSSCLSNIDYRIFHFSNDNDNK